LLDYLGLCGGEVCLFLVRASFFFYDTLLIFCVVATFCVFFCRVFLLRCSFFCFFLWRCFVLCVLLVFLGSVPAFSLSGVLPAFGYGFFLDTPWFALGMRMADHGGVSRQGNQAFQYAWPGFVTALLGRSRGCVPVVLTCVFAFGFFVRSSVTSPQVKPVSVAAGLLDKFFFQSSLVWIPLICLFFLNPNLLCIVRVPIAPLRTSTLYE